MFNIPLPYDEYYPDIHHEMNNSWVDNNLQYINKRLLERNAILLGYIKLASAKESIYKTKYPYGLVYEDNETFEKYWCHIDKETLESLRREENGLRRKSAWA